MNDEVAVASADEIPDDVGVAGARWIVQEEGDWFPGRRRHRVLYRVIGEPGPGRAVSGLRLADDGCHYDILVIAPAEELFDLRFELPLVLWPHQRELTRSGHYEVRDPATGRRIATFPTTPSCRRSLKNAQAHVKRWQKYHEGDTTP